MSVSISCFTAILYDKLFDALIAHDRLSNEQLAEWGTQQTELLTQILARLPENSGA
jgi:hypothetical protein